MLGVRATAMMPQEVKKSRLRKTKRKYQKNLPACNGVKGWLSRQMPSGIGGDMTNCGSPQSRKSWLSHWSWLMTQPLPHDSCHWWSPERWQPLRKSCDLRSQHPCHYKNDIVYACQLMISLGACRASVVTPKQSILSIFLSTNAAWLTITQHNIIKTSPRIRCLLTWHKKSLLGSLTLCIQKTRPSPLSCT